jgi:pimeloyl-ACP methyl ester carboxylesterase
MNSTESGIEDIQVLSSEGKGRAFVVLFDSTIYTQYAENISLSLKDKARVIIISCSLVNSTNWKILSQKLLEKLDQLAVRQASLVGFGSASSLAQYLALTEIKLVRSLVLINATCRPHPNWRDRLIDRLEGALPLGLPFRSSTEGFDSKPFLQRVRCPVLLAVTIDADLFIRSQVAEMEKVLPTAWMIALDSANQSAHLAKLVEEFQEVPVKCPQKNLA